MIDTKRIAAEKAVTYVKSGMTIGLGTGSTARYAIESLGLMVKDGLDIKAIATSLQSESLAEDLGIRLTNFSEVEQLDITIDGADEVDENLQLIKGGGGALLREKIVAASTRCYIIIADEKKLVRQLGNLPLPVEIIPFGYQSTLPKIKMLGGDVSLRKDAHEIFVTDNGNYIADCSFGIIANPPALQKKIKAVTGVVETGLFLNMANLIIIGCADGTLKIRIA
ncbi:MAG TPA: ribose-5-phosphate isomerase RpiA [Panacibacter sp.]|nr:ribose-5-phosphate isomerase RpiA [Panacibacter sp.]HNP45514.1 ribose-5-phosphate isomerase RpiA [Panacibacter sp.]